MIVLCTGMPRSGSTWSYNACKELLAAAFPEATVAGLYSERIDEAIAAHAAADHLVIKCHGVDDSGYRLIESGGCRLVYTYRDPREAVASGIAAFGHSLDKMIGMSRQSFRFMDFQIANGDPLLVPYTELSGAPVAALAAVGEHLRLGLDRTAIERVAGRVSRETLAAIAADIEGFDESELYRDDKYLLHRTSLIHRRHFREPGARWADVLSEDQTGQVEHSLQRWRQWWKPAG